MDKKLNYAIVEVTPRSIDIRYEPICTNHFELLTHENRNYTKESKERLERVIDSTSSNLSKEDAFKLFNDPQYNIYSKLFKSWSGTIHTSLYEPQTLTTWIGLGENSSPIKINFYQWLKMLSLNPGIHIECLEFISSIFNFSVNVPRKQKPTALSYLRYFSYDKLMA